jgi:hypothetical protein
MGQVHQRWWKICREIDVFFSGLNITCFTSICDLFTDSSLYIASHGRIYRWVMNCKGFWRKCQWLNQNTIMESA